MQNSHLIIAIDGPSGTGKSTTAKKISKALDITYLDTGAMYRALTYSAVIKGLKADQLRELETLTLGLEIQFNQDNHVMIDGVCREKEIRTPEVSSQVSYYCQSAGVRDVMTAKQRQFAQSNSCVLDGRDIGTVVFPNAHFKFFLVADYKIRAIRRHNELTNAGVKTTLVEVEKNLRERDALDASREVAPLKKAKDAIEIDTTQTTIEKQVTQILHHIRVVPENTVLSQPM
jgi:cytidylate kinase